MKIDLEYPFLIIGIICIYFGLRDGNDIILVIGMILLPIAILGFITIGLKIYFKYKKVEILK